jgi:hypothetical protein
MKVWVITSHAGWGEGYLLDGVFQSETTALRYLERNGYGLSELASNLVWHKKGRHGERFARMDEEEVR